MYASVSLPLQMKVNSETIVFEEAVFNIPTPTSLKYLLAYLSNNLLLMLRVSLLMMFTMKLQDYRALPKPSFSGGAGLKGIILIHGYHLLVFRLVSLLKPMAVYLS